jgi:hypothetical protein
MRTEKVKDLQKRVTLARLIRSGAQWQANSWTRLQSSAVAHALEPTCGTNRSAIPIWAAAFSIRRSNTPNGYAVFAPLLLVIDKCGACRFAMLVGAF